MTFPQGEEKPLKNQPSSMVTGIDSEQLQKKLDDQKTVLENHKSKLEEKTIALRRAREKTAHAESSMTEMQTRINQLEQETLTLRTKLRAAEYQVVKEASKVLHGQYKVEDLQGSLVLQQVELSRQRNTYEKAYEEMKEQFVVHRDALVALRREQALKQAQDMNCNQLHISLLKTSKRKLEDELDNARSALFHNERRLTSTQTQLEDLRRQHQILEKQHENYGTDRNRLREQLIEQTAILSRYIKYKERFESGQAAHQEMEHQIQQCLED